MNTAPMRAIARISSNDSDLLPLHGSKSLSSEVSRDIPNDIPRRLTRGGDPLFTAYSAFA